MPTLAELLKNEGVELPPQLTEKLKTIVEASDEVRALATTKDDLLQWKQENAGKIEAFEAEKVAAEEKYQAELKERERYAIENNDYKEQLAIHKERAEKASQTLALRNEEALKATQAENRMKVASLFVDQKKGELYGDHFTQTKLGDDGAINTVYNFDGQTFENFDALKDAVSSADYLANDLKGADYSGGGASVQNGANAGGFSNGDFSKEAIAKQFNLDS